MCGNTYVESVSRLADSLHRRIKNSYMECFEDALFEQALEFVNSWRVSHVRLAADITDESFYGDAAGFVDSWLDG